MTSGSNVTSTSTSPSANCERSIVPYGTPPHVPVQWSTLNSNDSDVAVAGAAAAASAHTNIPIKAKRFILEPREPRCDGLGECQCLWEQSPGHDHARLGFLAESLEVHRTARDRDVRCRTSGRLGCRASVTEVTTTQKFQRAVHVRAWWSARAGQKCNPLGSTGVGGAIEK